MENCYLASVGNGGHKKVTDYRLSRKEAVAVAMSYDLQLGMAVLDALDEAINGLIKVSESETLEDAYDIAFTAQLNARHSLSYSEYDSENDTRSKALRAFKRKS